MDLITLPLVSRIKGYETVEFLTFDNRLRSIIKSEEESSNLTIVKGDTDSLFIPPENEALNKLEEFTKVGRGKKLLSIVLSENYERVCHYSVNAGRGFLSIAAFKGPLQDELAGAFPSSQNRYQRRKFFKYRTRRKIFYLWGLGEKDSIMPLKIKLVYELQSINTSKLRQY